MDTLPTEQNDLEKINTEPATSGFGGTTPQTQFQPEPQLPRASATPPKGPKKSHKKRNIIIIAIVILVLIIGAAVAIWFFSRPKQMAIHKDTTPPVTKPIDDAQGIVSKLNTALTDKKGTNYQNPNIQFTTPTTTPPAVSPSYKASGADYYVTTTQAYGLTVSKTGDTAGANVSSTVDTAFTQAIIDQLTATFNKNNYHQTETMVASNEYQSDSVVCDVSLSNIYPVSIACANKDSYTKVSADMKPFVTAYRASNPNDTVDSVYSTPTIQTSTDNAYQNATIDISARQGVGGAVLLFYRHNNGTWQFFMGTQNVLSCTDYATTDLKAAFAGDTCATATGESTVGASTTSNTSTNTNSGSSSSTSGGVTPSPSGSTTPTPAPAR